jgi:hypothetical protein
MPEAQKEQTQDDRLVPIDTSGEAVDVELKESKVTAVEEEVVEEQQEAAPEAEKTEEEKPSADKGEHDDYSEKVNKRIAKLVGKLREAERREDAKWFGKDEAMTYTAFAIHRKLVEQQGYDPRSDEYYEEINRQIQEQFPNKFEGEKSKKVVDQTVAPAVKSTSKTKGKRTVRLTPSQVAIAKKLGVPLEEYAKYVKE